MASHPYQELYGSQAWRRRAKLQLRMSPLCAMCAERGLTAPAEIADHITPHDGDVNAFWSSPLQSLCKRCHDGRKRKRERRGYDTTIGLDGWPIDPAHPANLPRRLADAQVHRRTSSEAARHSQRGRGGMLKN
jgi:5-methylcytosine-specific restriction protein A